MSTFEYVSVLLAIVMSLALAHVLTGLAEVIRAKKVRFSLLHSGYVGLILFCCVDYWFSMWYQRNLESWALWYVALLLLLAAILYVAAWLIVPDIEADGTVDLVAFDNVNRRKYIAALFVYIAVAVAVNLSIAAFQWAVLINVGTLAMLGAAWLWQDKRVQWVCLAGIYALWAYYTAMFLPPL